MKSAAADAGPVHRRRIHYVDRLLQRRLLAGLVLLEAVLVASSVWAMHWRLQQVVEANLYRIHIADAGTLVPRLMNEALVLLGIFMLVNVVALLLAEGAWGRYVGKVLRAFMVLVEKTARLDFSPDPANEHDHEVLSLARSWRASERLRLQALGECTVALDALAARGDEPEAIRHTLVRLRELLH